MNPNKLIKIASILGNKEAQQITDAQNKVDLTNPVELTKLIFMPKSKAKKKLTSNQRLGLAGGAAGVGAVAGLVSNLLESPELKIACILGNEEAIKIASMNNKKRG